MPFSFRLPLPSPPPSLLTVTAMSWYDCAPLHTRLLRTLLSWFGLARRCDLARSLTQIQKLEEACHDIATSRGYRIWILEDQAGLPRQWDYFLTHTTEDLKKEYEDAIHLSR